VPTFGARSTPRDVGAPERAAAAAAAPSPAEASSTRRACGDAVAARASNADDGGCGSGINERCWCDVVARVATGDGVAEISVPRGGASKRSGDVSGRDALRGGALRKRRANGPYAALCASISSTVDDSFDGGDSGAESADAVVAAMAAAAAASARRRASGCGCGVPAPADGGAVSARWRAVRRCDVNTASGRVVLPRRRCMERLWRRGGGWGGWVGGEGGGGRRERERGAETRTREAPRASETAWS